MANTGKNVTGYVILGIADNSKDAAAIDRYYTNKRRFPQIARQYNSFYITGVNGEANSYYSNFDKYSSKIYDKLRTFAIDRAFIENHIKFYQINYFDKSLVVFSVTSPGEPVSINNEFYIRNGSNTNKMVGNSLNALFKRFSQV
jgi:predicted HTH transcriptional regulator